MTARVVSIETGAPLSVADLHRAGAAVLSRSPVTDRDRAPARCLAGIAARSSVTVPILDAAPVPSDARVLMRSGGELAELVAELWEAVSPHRRAVDLCTITLTAPPGVRITRLVESWHSRTPGGWLVVEL